jgi:hypothetical protein
LAPRAKDMEKNAKINETIKKLKLYFIVPFLLMLFNGCTAFSPLAPQNISET